MVTNYALDIIASCGFGVEANSFKDPENVFRKQVLITSSVAAVH